MNTPHPEIDELADLAEGLLPPARTADVEAHLGGCSDCTQLMAAVRAVPALLADVPSPPMPREAAARLDSVLRAEAARRTTDANADAQSPAPVPITSRRRTGTWSDRHPRLRVAAAAAATVAVLGGGVALIVSQDLSTGGSADTASAGRAEQRDSAEDEAAGGVAESAPDSEQADATKLDFVARRLSARQRADSAEGTASVTAAAASVHGLRVGMAAS